MRPSHRAVAEAGLLRLEPSPITEGEGRPSFALFPEAGPVFSQRRERGAGREDRAAAGEVIRGRTLVLISIENS